MDVTSFRWWSENFPGFFLQTNKRRAGFKQIEQNDSKGCYCCPLTPWGLAEVGGSFFGMSYTRVAVGWSGFRWICPRCHPDPDPFNENVRQQLGVRIKSDTLYRSLKLVRLFISFVKFVSTDFSSPVILMYSRSSSSLLFEYEVQNNSTEQSDCTGCRLRAAGESVLTLRVSFLHVCLLDLSTEWNRQIPITYYECPSTTYVYCFQRVVLGCLL